MRLCIPQLILHEAGDSTVPVAKRKKETERILGWQRKYGIPVKLCDLSNYSTTKKGFTKSRLKSSVDQMVRAAGLDASPDIFLDITDPLREQYMANLILSQVSRRKTPLLAVLGAKHLMPSSRIHRSLFGEIDYLTII